MEIDEIVKLVKVAVEKELKQKVDKDIKRIPIEASGRHIHLSERDAEVLFGERYQFTKMKDLSQPGQYACKERVRLIGPKGVIDGVIVLGPFRGETQVELSLTDARALGITPILRESGNIKDTPGVLITNGDRYLKLNEGVIIAKNHIHMTEEDSRRLNLKDRDRVKVKICSSLRPMVFEDVVVRVSNRFSLNMHIDYDEANACFLTADSYGEIYE
ncbi:phosphate propanoyltransferase [Cetobacterium sp.]|uniref:phosphate propanoyltransferase n=1 Tax=Cetobacterium sp. TaxID=2071632 RepID=UPI003AEF955D